MKFSHIIYCLLGYCWTKQWAWGLLLLLAKESYLQCSVLLLAVMGDWSLFHHHLTHSCTNSLTDCRRLGVGFCSHYCDNHNSELATPFLISHNQSYIRHPDTQLLLHKIYRKMIESRRTVIGRNVHTVSISSAPHMHQLYLNLFTLHTGSWACQLVYESERDDATQ